MDAVVGRLLRWVVRRIGSTNLLLLLLVLLGVGSAALGVSDRVRGVDVTLALTVGGLGVLAGWLISRLSLSPGWASAAAGMLGLVLVLVRVGRLADELFRLWWAQNRLARDLLGWMLGGPPPLWHPAREAALDLARGAGVLLQRVTAWGTALVGGSPGFDPAAVSFVWGLGLWAVGAWAGWLIARRARPVWAVTPTGALLLTAFYHVWGSHVYLLGLLLAALLLLAAVSYDERMRRWRATNVDYPELRPQTIAVSGFLALALVAMAQALPSLRLDRIRDLVVGPGEERSQESEAIAESFGMEGAGRPAFQEVQFGGLPRSHLLGSGPELSEQVAMTVRIDDGGAEAGGPPNGEPTPYYWRSHTYDRYTGSGWAAGETDVVAYEAGVPALTPTLGSPGAPAVRRVVRQEVRWLGEGRGMAYAAGTLMVADHDYAVAWRSPEDPFGATIRARTYRADSLVPAATEEVLRDDRGSYPAWVRERYLELPEEVPDRVRALARDLTATAATPYDRARAIENYLRQFPYTLDVGKPPGDRDVVEYFLFDLQSGYCDYYASAMVVLARAAGLPARLAVGYASGTYDADEARYVVTEANAHAWPEVYFPAYGWVRFEPTVGLAPPTYAGRPAAVWSEPEDPLQPAPAPWAGLRSRWREVVLGAVALLALAGIVWQVADRWRLGRKEPAAALASLYRRLRRLGGRLGVPMEAGDTPREFGKAFADWLERAGEGSVQEALAHRGEDLIWLTEAYGRASYSPRLPDAADRERAVRLWVGLWWRLRLVHVAHGLGLVQMGQVR